MTCAINTYIIGDRIIIPMSFLFNNADFSIVLYNVSVTILKPDLTAVAGMGEIVLVQSGPYAGTADFSVAKTSLLTAGLYYIRARLTLISDGTVVVTWKPKQINFIKVA